MSLALTFCLPNNAKITKKINIAIKLSNYHFNITLTYITKPSI